MSLSSALLSLFVAGLAPTTTFDLKSYMEAARVRTEAALDASLASRIHQTDLIVESMRYSLLAGGKRVRPMLCYAATEMFSNTDRLFRGLHVRVHRWIS